MPTPQFVSPPYPIPESGEPGGESPAEGEGPDEAGPQGIIPLPRETITLVFPTRTTVLAETIVPAYPDSEESAGGISPQLGLLGLVSLLWVLLGGWAYFLVRSRWG
jgi:hypothetical protein